MTYFWQKIPDVFLTISDTTVKTGKRIWDQIKTGVKDFVLEQPDKPILITLDCASKTHQGGREENQDYSGCRWDVEEPCYAEWIHHQCQAHSYCFVVADGLGGHRGGQVASQIAVETILQDFPNLTEKNVHEQLSEMIIQAHLKIKRKARENPALTEMKTTCVLFVILGHKAYWATVGDSRLYIFRKNAVESKPIIRSKDHSVVQVLLDMGEIDEKDVRGHPDRNRILKTLGMKDDLLPKIFPAPEEEPFILKRGDYILLCTDGFWEYFSDTKLYRMFFEKFEHLPFKEKVDFLYTSVKFHVDTVEQREKADNVTFQLITIH